MTAYDPRLTPARPDLAAAHLRGIVEAARYVEGQRAQVIASVLDLKRAPRSEAALDTQLLRGEMLRVFDEEDGWSWVQAERDAYVGYVASHGLAANILAPTHHVIVCRTFVYPARDLKKPIMASLPLGARITVDDDDGAFASLHGGGFVYRDHLMQIDRYPGHDVVSLAESLIGVPYLWGGRSPDGIDCSGLVQLSFAMRGVALPRDTPMQQACGDPLPLDEMPAGLRRGDLVFWKGHVGLMRDDMTLLHANAHHMLVASEPLAIARDRIFAGPGREKVVTIRRLMNDC